MLGFTVKPINYQCWSIAAPLISAVTIHKFTPIKYQ